MWKLATTRAVPWYKRLLVVLQSSEVLMLLASAMIMLALSLARAVAVVPSLCGEHAVQCACAEGTFVDGVEKIYSGGVEVDAAGCDYHGWYSRWCYVQVGRRHNRHHRRHLLSLRLTPSTSNPPQGGDQCVDAHKLLFTGWEEGSAWRRCEITTGWWPVWPVAICTWLAPGWSAFTYTLCMVGTFTMAEWLTAHHLRRSPAQRLSATLKWVLSAPAFCLLFLIPSLDAHATLTMRALRKKTLTYSSTPRQTPAVTPKTSHNELDQLVSVSRAASHNALDALLDVAATPPTPPAVVAATPWGGVMAHASPERRATEMV